nr:hypothetical protein [Muricauda sp. UBA7809]|tara:strand:- start:12199 stop:12405 length:207 start_codon:yes stop_codon:yes gene_type:complete
MKDSIRTSELMNYEQNSSNSNNYVPSPVSSSPESFPSLMEEGILVEYREMIYTTEIVEKGITSENNPT